MLERTPEEISDLKKSKLFYKFNRYVFCYYYPFVFLITGIGLAEYLIVRAKNKLSENDLTLEVGMGRIPYYRLYNRGDYVGVDWHPINVRGMRRLAKFFGVDGDHLEEHVVADNFYLPFREGAFDKIVNVGGNGDPEECLRVLREDGEVVI